MTIIGAAVATCFAVVGALVVLDPFGGDSEGVMSVSIDTPYVGQGVATGTDLMMHGAKVGEVTSVTSLPGGKVRLDTDLQSAAVVGLTDTMKIDFRPANYFGVTGINVTEGTGGSPLREGTQLNLLPEGNFTLQALLSRVRDVSAGALTPQLIQAIDRATRFTDGLDPLVETVLTVSQTVARVQNVPLGLLLQNIAGIGVALPSFVDDFSVASDSFINAGLGESLSEDTYRNRQVPFFDAAANDLFGAVGKLESSHVDDLLPVIESVKALTDIVPALVKPDQFGATLVELRTRLEKMFNGTPDQRALQVRIILDSLPGVAAPFGGVAPAPIGVPPAPVAVPGVPQ